jgi:hypothetical protein
MEIDIQKIIERIHELEKLREELLAGDLSPEGAWIHEYVVYKVYASSGTSHWYRYAKWQAHEPIFIRHPKGKQRKLLKEPGYTKHQHIGRVESSTKLGMDEKVEEAYQSWWNRKRLEAVVEVLTEIQSILTKAEGLMSNNIEHEN